MNTSEILEKISSLRALVIGDLRLDRWCRYDSAIATASGGSAQVPVTVTSCESSPGAGAMAAGHLVALRAKQVSVLGVIGDDGYALELERALRRSNIWPDLVVRSATFPTGAQTRFINDRTEQEDLPCIDYINVSDIPRQAEDELLERMTMAWNDFDVVLVSDHGHSGRPGILTEAIRGRLSELAVGTPAKVVWVDSRGRPELFRNVIVSCRSTDADAACERLFGEVNYEQLRYRMRTGLFIVTKPDIGALLVRPMALRWVRSEETAQPPEGPAAADSFAAAGAAALAVGASLEEAAGFANLVLSITSRNQGRGSASPSDVLDAAAALGK